MRHDCILALCFLTLCLIPLQTAVASPSSSTATQDLDYTLMWQAALVWAIILLGLLLWIRKLSLEIKRRKIAEAALVQSERKFRETLTHLDEGYYSVSLDGVLLDHNQASNRILGIAPERDMRGVNAHEFWQNPEDRAKYLDDLMTHGFIKNHLMQAKKITGEKVVFLVNSRLITDNENHPVKIEGTVTDITLRKRAEEDLQKERDLLHSITETSPVGIVLVDRHGQIVFANQRAEQILGLTKDEITRQTYNAPTWRITAENGEPFPEDQLPCRHVMSTGQPVFDVRHAIEWPDGRRILLSVNAAPLLNAEGRVNGIVITLENITERRKTEEELRENEVIFSSFLKNSPVYVFFKDKNIRTLRLSSNYEQMLGMPLDQALGKTMDELFPSDLAKSMVADDRKILEEGECVEVEEEFGGRIYETTKFPIIKDGQPFMLAGFTLNITERKRAEQALRKSEEKFRKAFHTSPDAVNINRLEDGTYTSINPGFTRIMGYTEEEILGISSIEINIWNDIQDRKRLVAGLRKDGMVANLEAAFRAKDGSIRYGLMSASIIELDKVPHILSITRDITELKTAEAEKAKLEDQLRQAQKMEAVGRLAGGVAHDFNNMLAVIIGHTELALDGVDAASQPQADLMAIQKAAERSANLVRQLLAFARKQTVVPKVLDLNETVESVINMLRRLIGEDIDLIWMPGTDLWPVRIDPGQIDQMLANLCINARDAIAGPGRIMLETNNFICDEAFRAAHRDVACGEYVRLTVTDNGCGMDAETQANIFEPFFTTKEMGRGTGLGLSTVYGVVKQNNGAIDVQSAPGSGTAFQIYLPRFAKQAGQIFSPIPAPPPKTGHETILLVEDDPALLTMTQTILRHLGYHVLAAGTPSEAIRLAEEHKNRIHLLITDVVMPEVNGRDLAARLLTACPNLHCLFMSGYPNDVIASHGVLDEGRHFIQKPFIMKDLAVKLREILDVKPITDHPRRE